MPAPLSGKVLWPDANQLPSSQSASSHLEKAGVSEHDRTFDSQVNAYDFCSFVESYHCPERGVGHHSWRCSRDHTPCQGLLAACTASALPPVLLFFPPLPNLNLHFDVKRTNCRCGLVSMWLPSVGRHVLMTMKGAILPGRAQQATGC